MVLWFLLVLSHIALCDNTWLFGFLIVRVCVGGAKEALADVVDKGSEDQEYGDADADNYFQFSIRVLRCLTPRLRSYALLFTAG